MFDYNQVLINMKQFSVLQKSLKRRFQNLLWIDILLIFLIMKNEINSGVLCCVILTKIIAFLD